jgi:hypothetical protein
MAIRQQFLSICSHHVELITGRKAMGMREVIARHVAPA